MAVFFIAMAAIGFGEDYKAIYVQHVQIVWFVHVHGAILTAWLLVFFVQTLLIRKSNFKLHRKLGLSSVVLGVLVYISMGVVTLHAHIGYPLHKDISWDNVTFLFLTMNLFALFFIWGIIKRKNAATHKRLLFLATLVLISAGYNRVLLYAGFDATLHWFPALEKNSLLSIPIPSAFFLYNDLLLIPLFIYDLLSIKTIHSVTIKCVACIIAVQIFLIMIWGLLP